MKEHSFFTGFSELLNATNKLIVPCELRAFSEMTIQPARHACCVLRAGFLAFQPVADNTRGTRDGQVVSSFQKILRGSQLTWYIL